MNYEELWYLAMNQNEAAYNLLVSLYTKNYEHYYYKKYGYDMMIEDFRSEFYFAVYQAIQSFSNQQIASFHTFTHQCVRNRLFSYKRGQMVRIQPVLADQECVNQFQESSYLQEMVSPFMFETIEQQEFIEQLTDKQRDVLNMRIAGYTYKEIAEQLSCSIGVVRQIHEKLKTNAKRYGLIEKGL
ncbi:MAG: RNA polymerase sigma factor [Culicoidibacterales bacterium]